MNIDKNYQPEVAFELLEVDKETGEVKDLTNSLEWEKMRNEGIGGSDAAIILGCSPWTTLKDLYFQKKGIAPEKKDNSNEYILKAGHRLENFIAQCYGYITGAEIVETKAIYKHPKYPFMRANLDRLAIFKNSDGSVKEVRILEIKSTSKFNSEKWIKEGEETVPENYEAQVRHYMSVMNIEKADVCCLLCEEIFRLTASLLSEDFSVPEDEFPEIYEKFFSKNILIRHLERDVKYEENLIEKEKFFWEENIGKNIVPEFTVSEGSKALETVEKYRGKTTEETEVFEDDIKNSFEKRETLLSQINTVKKRLKTLEEAVAKEEATIISSLGDAKEGEIEDYNVKYKVSYKEGSYTERILAKDLRKLKERFPDVAKEFVTKSRGTGKYVFKKIYI